MRHVFYRIGIIFALLITVGATSVSASNAHHCLIGEPIKTWKTTDNWSKNYEEFALTSPANTNWDEFCIYMWVETNQTFAFNNHFFNPGEAKQVGPSSDQATINKDGGTGGGVATDGTTNAWKYTGATGLVKICAAQSSGGNGQGEWKPYVWVEESKEIEILKGNKIMFYFGMSASWNKNWNVLRTSNTSEKTADQQYHRLPESKCYSWISVAYVSPAQYYVGQTEWAGVQMESTAEAGCLYSVYKDNKDDSDKIYKNVSVGAIPHFATTTVNKTVGAVDSEIAATADTTIYGNKQVLYYYYTTDGGTTFTKFDPSDISSLAVGVYTIYALGWDGHILVRSDNTVTLNVGVTISLDANGGTDGDVTSVFATSGIAASTGNIAAASLPTKTGYTFNGFWTSGASGGIEVINENGEWKTDVSGYTDNSGNWICSAASTLYAHWTPKSFTVTLEGMEADSNDSVLVNVTYDAVLPELKTKHTKAHYDLLGYWAASDDNGMNKTKQLIDANGNWNPNVEGYTGNDGEGHPTWIRDGINISLFADWTEHPYTVTTLVDPAGAGTLSCGSSVTAKWVTLSEPITATASIGYSFREWDFSKTGEDHDVYSDSTEGYTSLSNPIRIRAQHDGTLTAKFTEIPTHITITKIGGGEVQINGEDKESTSVGVTTTRTLTAVAAAGYTFSGWTLPENADFEIEAGNVDNPTITLRGKGAGDAGEIIATFTECWVLSAQSEGWGSAEFTIANITVEDGKAIGYADIELPANTNLQFKVVDKSTSSEYKNGVDKVYYMTNGNSHNWSFATDKKYNCGITTAGAGTYRFIWNITDKKMTVTYPNFVIYRTGDKADDPRAQNTDVESYDGGTISQAIEFRMRVNRLDYWYTLCLPFEVNAVRVWEDGAYYKIEPYWRTEGKYYTGHYIIRTPVSTTDFAIENFDSRDRWVDPSSADGYLPSANTPYIIQWHDEYFQGKYISFFGTAGQTIPTAMDKGSYASSDETVNIYGNNSMTTGTVCDAYLLDPYYGSDGAWMREEIGTYRSVLPFECFILANPTTTAKYSVLRRDMADDTPTGLDTLSKTEDTVSKVLINNRIYIIRGGKIYTIQGTFVKEVE